MTRIIKEHKIIGTIDISTKDINANIENAQSLRIYFREISKGIIDIVVYPTSFDKANRFFFVPTDDKFFFVPTDDTKWLIHVGISNINWVGRNRARDIYKYLVLKHKFKQENS